MVTAKYAHFQIILSLHVTKCRKRPRKFKVCCSRESASTVHEATVKDSMLKASAAVRLLDQPVSRSHHSTSTASEVRTDKYRPLVLGGGVGGGHLVSVTVPDPSQGALNMFPLLCSGLVLNGKNTAALTCQHLNTFKWISSMNILVQSPGKL